MHLGRNGFRRRMRIALSGLVIFLAATLAACTKPYGTPVVVEDLAAPPWQIQNPPFDGIVDLIPDGPEKRLRVLWVHGMCRHDADWAVNRATTAALLLGAQARTQPAEIVAKTKMEIVRASIPVPAGTIDISFLLWSPLTDPYKKRLDFDRPGTDPARFFPYERARLNEDLKLGLINNCLSDAVVYAGESGNDIRDAMFQAVCVALGGSLEAQRSCDFQQVGSTAPLAIVSESLGSKLLMDAVRALWNQPSAARRAGLRRALGSVQMVYLLSNQIPLLDLTTPQRAGEKSEDTPPTTFAEFLSILGSARGGLAAGPRPLTVVAFSDPNDLLSYRLIRPVIGAEPARLINVIVSNDHTYFRYLERPDNAHCGYGWNASALALLAQGHHPPQANIVPAVPKRPCF